MENTRTMGLPDINKGSLMCLTTVTQQMSMTDRQTNRTVMSLYCGMQCNSNKIVQLYNSHLIYIIETANTLHFSSSYTVHNVRIKDIRLNTCHYH